MMNENKIPKLCLMQQHIVKFALLRGMSLIYLNLYAKTVFRRRRIAGHTTPCFSLCICKQGRIFCNSALDKKTHKYEHTAPITSFLPNFNRSNHILKTKIELTDVEPHESKSINGFPCRLYMIYPEEKIKHLFLGWYSVVSPYFKRGRQRSDDSTAFPAN